MGLRERQQAVARASIIEGATVLFLGGGYTQTTMADIAAEAGLARRTLYNHMESKGEVLLACLDDRVAAPRERSMADDREHFVALDDPHEAVAFFAEMTGRVAERFLPLYRVAVEAAAHDGDVAKRLRAQEEHRFEAQAFSLRVLRDKGQLRTDVPFEHLHRGFWLLGGPRPVLDAIDAGWSMDEYVAFLSDALQRFLLPA